MSTVDDWMPQANIHDWPEQFWPHQTFGCESVIREITNDQRRIVLTAPTGMGKSKMMCALIEWASSHYRRTVLYTHRRMLFSQTSRVLSDHGIEHGLRASGYKPHLLRDIQLAMTQTEVNAVFRRKARDLHPANLVLSDELHAQGGDSLPEIHRVHIEQGAAVVGVTATPLDLVGEWDRLIVAGKTSDGFKCGALVKARTYCPDEPDMKHIKKYRVGEDLTDKQNRQVMMRPGIFGRVHKHWTKLNPKRLPTILFAPDVAGSLWFAEEFHKAGVRAAHISAKELWMNGEVLDSTDENRDMVLKATESGEVEILCNRFVLREGIDLPHIAHCIFACVMGSLKTYLQSGGRALRSHPSLDHIVVQDHGANYRRHGSLNEDRVWFLGQKGYRTTGLRVEKMRERPETEPITCPRCHGMRLSGPECPHCGHRCHSRSRVVVQKNGELKEVHGAAYAPRRTAMKPDTIELWTKMYHRAKSAKWDATFLQAEALFNYENHYYPPRDLPLMPANMNDFFERVADVPRHRLHD